MFFSQEFLSKKSQLGTIWIAAHMERKLKRKNIVETSVEESADTILKLDIPLALRVSAVLMLGVVRVHSRQVGYLYTDASEAVVKFQKLRVSSHEPQTDASQPQNEITEKSSFLPLLDSEVVELCDVDVELPSTRSVAVIRKVKGQHMLEDVQTEDSFLSQISPIECFALPNTEVEQMWTDVEELAVLEEEEEEGE
eukprot:CAMPEP_0118924014 /NCGR_PEP_ID=MMETSP1169-20130426/2337_1 /TAXON_ID=36882 /ORGANISM="Pyramimonas obovata, Strain CCMP722" /LENGTH=195 /DNA_ID=CAMNT_0006865089 /DNA_START=169 /DNA_END=753 /DNA_ORIENTATION=+